MNLTFYMTVNEEAALNKEISMPTTKSGGISLKETKFRLYKITSLYPRCGCLFCSI